MGHVLHYRERSRLEYYYNLLYLYQQKVQAKIQSQLPLKTNLMLPLLVISK